MEPTKEGWLVKQGHFVKNWKQRYFVTHKDELIYRKDAKKDSSVCGTINLKHCRLAHSETDKKSFEIVDTTANKVFILVAPSIVEKEEWISVIKRISNPHLFAKRSNNRGSQKSSSFHQIRSRPSNPYKNPLPPSLTGKPAPEETPPPQAPTAYTPQKWKMVGKLKLKKRIALDTARVGQACQPFLPYCRNWHPQTCADALLPLTGTVRSEVLRAGPPTETIGDLRIPETWRRPEIEEEPEEEREDATEEDDDGSVSDEEKREGETKEDETKEGVENGDGKDAADIIEGRNVEGGEGERVGESGGGEGGEAGEGGGGSSSKSGEGDRSSWSSGRMPSIIPAGEWMEAFGVIMRESSQGTRALMLSSLMGDFINVAVRTARIIVHEIPLPQAEKTIKRVSTKGLKYLANGIFFTIAQDEDNLYGSDEYAMKAAGNALVGAQAIFNATCNILQSPPVLVPLMAVVTYLGFRISCVAQLPISANTLVHGTDDGTESFAASSPEFESMCCLIGRVLNLSQRKCNNGEGWTVGPFDLEGHFGDDSRFYITSTSRLFPPEKPTDLHQSSMYRLLRPEFAMKHPVPLCSDGYLPKANLTKEAQDLDSATAKLLNETIPDFAKRLPDLWESLYFLGPKHLVHLMHQEGINVRHCGLVRAHCTCEGPGVNVRRMLVSQMVARAAKNILRTRLRAHITSSTLSSSAQLLASCRQLVIDFLEEWSHRSLWCTIFTYVQTHFLDNSPAGLTQRKSGYFESPLIRKSSSNTLADNPNRKSVGPGMLGNMDIRTMEGLRKAVSFNLVLPLFCDLIGMQITDNQITWACDIQMDSKKTTPPKDVPLPIIVAQVKSFGVAFRMMGDTIKQKAEKTLNNVEIDRNERRTTAAAAAELKKGPLEDLRIALRLYNHAVLVDSCDMRSEISRLSLLETLEKSEDRTFPQALTQTAHRRKRHFTAKMMEVVHKDLEDKILDTMKDTLAYAVSNMAAWSTFMSQKHTDQEIEEYQSRPQHTEVVNKLLETTKTVIKVISDYFFRPLPHTLNFPKLLRCLGLAYRQIGMHPQAIAMFAYAERQLETCQRHMSVTDPNLLPEFLGVASNLAETLAIVGLYNDAVWWRIKHLRTVRIANDHDLLIVSYAELAKLLSKQGTAKYVSLALQTWGVVIGANPDLLTRSRTYIITCLEMVKRREGRRDSISQQEINQLIKSSDEKTVFSAYCSLQNSVEQGNSNDKILQMARDILYGDGNPHQPPETSPTFEKRPMPNPSLSFQKI